MTYQERLQLHGRCCKCLHNAKKVLPVDFEGYPITSEYDLSKKYGRREFYVCKLLFMYCSEIDEPCPADYLTEEEIEEREIEFDEGE